jgi:mono/diheme cytochrome c family protein
MRHLLPDDPMNSTLFRVRLRAAIAFLVLSLAGPAVALAATGEARGKLLYETRCIACHADSVHNREARRAKSFDGLRAQVLRWSAQSGGNWAADEIDDVTRYLNQRYYGLPCPQTVCKADQALLTH